MLEHFELMMNFATHPDRWRLISNILTDEIPTIADPVNEIPEYLKWFSKNKHKHVRRELIITLAGSYPYGFNNKYYILKPGSVSLIDPMIEHLPGYPDFMADVTNLVIIFLNENVIVAFHVHKDNNLSCYKYILDQSSVTVMLLKIWSELQNKQTLLPPLLIRLKFTSTLSCLLSEILEAGLFPKAKHSHSKLQQKMIENICHQIDLAAGSNCDLEDLASLAGYSKYHFSRVFKKHVGCNLQNYIHRCRVKKVKELLESGKTKKEIADILNFSGPVSFAHWYKKHCNR